MYGLPVIGGRSGGVTEAIEENKSGFLVNPESINDICTSIRKLYYDPDLRKRFGESARLRVKKYFNMNKSDRLLNVFNQL